MTAPHDSDNEGPNDDLEVMDSRPVTRRKPTLNGNYRRYFFPKQILCRLTSIKVVIEGQSYTKEESPSAPPRTEEGSDTKNEGPSAPVKMEEGPLPSTKQRSPDVAELWDTDDDIDFGDREGAYFAFTNRRKDKRKRSAAASRKFKKNANADSSVDPRPKCDDGPERKKRRKQCAEIWDISSDNDAETEDPLPGYLRKRREDFDQRAVLEQAGLRLPPDYDDVYFSDDEGLEFLAERPMFKDSQPCAKYEDITLPYSMGLIPASIGQWLRKYQVDGAAFLHELFVYQRGGILGDDMGLGKTIQVIAFLAAAYGKTGDERDAKRMRKMRNSFLDKWYPRTLIVCPGSLLQNWRAELNSWGWWHIDIYYGPDKDQVFLAARSGRLEIMLTTYTTYRNNKDQVNMVDWDCVIADECHMIKEPTSETTRAMNEVNALCRIGLTGTAIQNNYEELWTLLNWTNPGKFGALSLWKDQISMPLKIGQSHNATHHEINLRNKTIEKLRAFLPRFFLRRMKSLIAHQLPKKVDRVVFCPLTDTQAASYENYLDSTEVSYVKYSSERCDCGSGDKAGWCCYKELPSGVSWQKYIFPVITNLQKLSNHLALLIPQNDDSTDKKEKALDALQLAVPNHWQQLYETRDSILNYANPEFCGKWGVLRRLLKWWHVNGDKVLVFSHSVRILKMLQMLFCNTSYNFSYLDGSMSYEERSKVVDEYNANPRQFVFLISSRAGGVGLNITSANKIVVVDPNWNPSYDLQAQVSILIHPFSRDGFALQCTKRDGSLRLCIDYRGLNDITGSSISHWSGARRRSVSAHFCWDH